MHDPPDDALSSRSKVMLIIRNRSRSPVSFVSGSPAASGACLAAADVPCREGAFSLVPGKEQGKPRAFGPARSTKHILYQSLEPHFACAGRERQQGNNS